MQCAIIVPDHDENKATARVPVRRKHSCGWRNDCGGAHRDRAMCGNHRCALIDASNAKTPPPEGDGVLCIEHRMRRISVLCRPGSDLLSQGLSHSTIGAEVFNGRVRNGIGLRLFAKTTRPAKDRNTKQSRHHTHRVRVDIENESNQANRTISTGKLHALLHFHTRPINVVVFHGSQGNTRFEVGFPLRCFQRLSRPYIAMLHCRWRDNSSTRGTFTPVLSY